MGVVALGGAALVASAGTLLTQAAQPGGHCSPVLSFHMDQPYLDVTGTAVPYYPPPGVRSGDSAAELSEDVFRSLLL
jgi:hypothetical protein